jgi:hypothetical protein
MAEDEKSVMDRLRDRLGGVERLIERLDERMLGKLGKDDASILMEHATAGDDKLREDFLGRLSDFRVEVRGAFQHAEKENASAIYKAVTESEGRLTVAINALNATIAALASTPQQERRGWHPVVTYGGGGVSLATVAAILIYMATNGRFGIPN